MNLFIGILCLSLTSYIFFFSGKEGYNLLGYKSFQLNSHKNIWLWTNRCFGLLTLAGSLVYLAASLLLILLKNTEHSAIINKFGLIYIVISIIITELHALYMKIKS